EQKTGPTEVVPEKIPPSPKTDSRRKGSWPRNRSGCRPAPGRRDVCSKAKGPRLLRERHSNLPASGDNYRSGRPRVRLAEFPASSGLRPDGQPVRQIPRSLTASHHTRWRSCPDTVGLRSAEIELELVEYS